MVDRGGEQRRRAAGPATSPPQQRPRVRRRRRRARSRPGGRPRRAPSRPRARGSRAGAGRASAAGPAATPARCRRPARPPAASASSSSTARRVPGSQTRSRLGGQRVDRAVRLVAAADQPGQPRVGRARPRRGGPALGHRRGPATRRTRRWAASPGRCRRPTRAPAGRRRTRSRRSAPPARARRAGGRPVARRSRTPSPPAAQHRRRMRAPVVEQQLDPAHQLEGRARRRAVDEGARRARWWPGGGTTSTGSRVDRPSRSATRTDQGTVMCRRSSRATTSRAPDQLLHGLGQRLGAAVGVALVEVVEQGPGAGGRSASRPAPPRLRPARRGEHLGEHGDRPQRVRRTPEQREPQQPVDGTVDRRRRGTHHAASPSTPTGARCSAASSTARSSTDSVSSARITDGRVATRAASCEESCGAGTARSGRASSSAESCSSDQPRNWSARVRGAGVGIRPILRGDPGAPRRVRRRRGRRQRRRATRWCSRACCP